MRRKMKIRRTGRRNALIYACAGIALGVYGVPKLPRMTHGLPRSYSAVWILFLALFVGANLYFLFGADKERARLLEDQSYAEARTETQSGRVRVRG